MDRATDGQIERSGIFFSDYGSFRHRIQTPENISALSSTEGISVCDSHLRALDSGSYQLRRPHNCMLLIVPQRVNTVSYFHLPEIYKG